ncbi:MAG: hypothetical protein ACI35O_10080 [Bacillaceae bacterium]
MDVFANEFLLGICKGVGYIVATLFLPFLIKKGYTKAKTTLMRKKGGSKR